MTRIVVRKRSSLSWMACSSELKMMLKVGVRKAKEPPWMIGSLRVPPHVLARAAVSAHRPASTRTGRGESFDDRHGRARGRRGAPCAIPIGLVASVRAPIAKGGLDQCVQAGHEEYRGHDIGRISGRAAHGWDEKDGNESGRAQPEKAEATCLSFATVKAAGRGRRWVGTTHMVMKCWKPSARPRGADGTSDTVYSMPLSNAV